MTTQPTTLIAIEGIDGSGKTTLAYKLSKALNANYIPFPSRNPTAPVAHLVNSALYGDGHLGNDPASMALIFALDRATRRQDLEAPGPKVVDRYVASSAAYTAARLGKDVDGGWVGDIEFNKLHLPRPDLHILLNLPVEDAQRRLATRDKLDIYEEDLTLQQRVADNYHAMARGNWCSPWVTLDATLPTLELVRQAVMAIAPQVGEASA